MHSLTFVSNRCLSRAFVRSRQVDAFLLFCTMMLVRGTLVNVVTSRAVDSLVVVATIAKEAPISIDGNGVRSTSTVLASTLVNIVAVCTAVTFRAWAVETSRLIMTDGIFRAAVHCQAFVDVIATVARTFEATLARTKIASVRVVAGSMPGTQMGQKDQGRNYQAVVLDWARDTLQLTRCM